MHLHKPEVLNPMGCANDFIISSPYNKLLCFVFLLSSYVLKIDPFVFKACSMLLKLFTFGAEYKPFLFACLNFHIRERLCRL